MNEEEKTAYLVGANHRIQYTNGACGSEWSADIRKFEDYLVCEATRHNVDLIAEEFSEGQVHLNSASGCTVRDAARRAQKPHLFCNPEPIEDATERISNDEREEEWLARLKHAKARRLLIVCGNGHIDSFTKRLQTAGFVVTVLSRDWGNDWMLRD